MMKELYCRRVNSKIGRMGKEESKGFCGGACSKAMADYLHDQLWVTYELPDNDGTVPNTIGARQLRLLTRYEYLHSIKDILGLDLPKEWFSNYIPGRHVLFPTVPSRPFSDVYLEEYLEASLYILDNLSVGELTDCDVTASTCRKSLLSDIGGRLFRRPLSIDESSDYEVLASSIGLGVLLRP
ncbi:MAG: hypothetical protein ABW155_19330 [Candidatus Thiodiazotropha sp.]